MLPDGWRIATLTNLADKISDGLHGTPSYKEGTGFYFINGNNIENGRIIISSSTKSVDELEFQKHKKDLNKSTILISINGTIGNVAYYEGETVILGKSAAYINLKAGVSREYIYYFVTSDVAQDYFKNELTGSTIRNLSLKTIKQTPVLIPPLPAQKKIADILATWDRAIAAQERLIANARAQKKALMQTLLTQKKRLSGFSDEWRSICLGDLGELRKGKGIPRGQVQESGYPCIRYGEIYTQHHEQVRQFSSFINADTAAESELISNGDILFTCSGETAEEIGKCVTYLGDEQAYAGSDIIILSPRGVNSAFLSYVLNDTDVTEQKRRFGQGKTVVHISSVNLSKLTFKLPSRPEQEAIAAILDTETDYIGKLDTDLATLRHEKSALMQQLLTGQRRVKVEEMAR